MDYNQKITSELYFEDNSKKYIKEYSKYIEETTEKLESLLRNKLEKS